MPHCSTVDSEIYSVQVLFPTSIPGELPSRSKNQMMLADESSDAQFVRDNAAKGVYVLGECPCITHLRLSILVWFGSQQTFSEIVCWEL